MTAANRLYRRRGKRLLDLALTLPLLVLLAPLLGLVAVAVRLLLGSPVLFRQVRPGYQGRPFVLTKFRTMREARDASGALLPDGQRLTRFGRLLRRTSLDELPELIGVVRGDLSLVGPRPLLMQYLERYSPQQARRHEVAPGITGLAQVAGRNAVSWEDRLQLDVEYVDRLGLALDLRILARTVLFVLRGRGVSAQGHSTMPEFQGSDR
ncbi:MAG TPA: sugar transferase [Thermoanaerobaculia bacterium]|nr:sugar transferase [Thermoanaerobaculia bacterium]